MHAHIQSLFVILGTTLLKKKDQNAAALVQPKHLIVLSWSPACGQLNYRCSSVIEVWSFKAESSMTKYTCMHVHDHWIKFAIDAVGNTVR